MSWSYGAVHEKGLILKENDFKKLLKLSNSFKEKYELANEDIDDMYGGDLQDYVDDFGMYDCYVTVCDLNKLVGFYDNGEAQYDNIETIMIDEIMNVIIPQLDVIRLDIVTMILFSKLEAKQKK